MCVCGRAVGRCVCVCVRGGGGGGGGGGGVGVGGGEEGGGRFNTKNTYYRMYDNTRAASILQMLCFEGCSIFSKHTL